MGRLVVVSNRVAVPRERRAGGLAAAMHAALSQRGGLWFGWSGRVVAAPADAPKMEAQGAITYALTDLGRADYEAYYLGYANRALWPLFHYQPNLVEFSRANLEGYLRVNRRFAAQLARLLREDDTVWVHDYHLIPLASELRALGVGARIGFFLHIPLPAPELMAMLPGHRRLVESLADYDLVGLQTEADRHALADYFVRECGASTADGRLILTPGGRRFRIGAFPISIDTALIARLATSGSTNAATRGLVSSLQGRALAIGVDRLDYSKGLPERFEAFGRFLARHAERRRQVSMMQIAPLSREDVPEYRELRERLERMAGATNGQYAEPDWVPIRYINRSFQQATLSGYYRVAQIGLVTPLRDGMNLVAKEFVAAQGADDPGVLVLSRFAGSANELAGALLVNPHDVDDTAEAIEQALAMPLAERRARWQTMFDWLRTHDIAAWRDAFLAALDAG
ncbi:alpha,alpha-trehalose-phosphate synthase (UDP-forming) [Dokdonella koreensis]|uniref:Alpha,alpha-trehalose-phosphate synthase n=1 Tax=Dokdonella koreensis DS-123 TaxID=1300342 RepID=A0A160DX98_9GAMM|nr:trehalose-6-phosphate synthase [Dokdonella koreensis]ANB18950.1 Alpha,alpha-trehalose-phosphate synthase [Dokdonella koreensis DS-123]